MVLMEMYELIETLWNVNIDLLLCVNQDRLELIETLWNVNSTSLLLVPDAYMN